MAEAHIQIEVGKVKFTAEGSPEWVDKKYEEFLRHMTELQRLLPATSQEEPGDKMLVGDQTSVP